MALPVLPAAATAAGQAGVAAASATAGSTLAAALGPIGLGAALLSAGISYFSQRKAKKKAKKAARSALGELLNFDGTNNFIPVIYGVRRIEGTLVYISTNDAPGGDPNEFLYLVYALCEGEVHQILESDVLIDDLPVSDARFNYTDSINTSIYLGTDAQTADTMLINETADWTADHKLSGIAYIRVRLKWDRKAFNNIPVVSALVYGKKVYDPRTTTTVYSTNPALCIRDYLTNERYGKGLDVSLIDDTAISAAADFYDTTVTFYTGGTTGKVFEFNAIVDTEQSILDNLKDMMLCCRGFMPYTNGIYQLIPDKSSSSVFAFDTDNIISGISIRGENKADKYNRMVCTFTDPTNNYQENTVIWPEAGSTEEIAFLLEDNGTELIGEIDLPYITNFYAARDLARVFLLRSRNAIRTSFSANSDALNVSVGDVVTVTHPTPGWSAKPFQVEEVAINYDGTCTVALIEYDSSIYSYDPASEQLAYADTDLPNPFSVAAPTSLVITESTILSKDGSVIREITLAWTAADDAFVESYEVQFKKSGATDYFSVFTFEPRFVTTYDAVPETYDYRIRAINSLGVSGAFLTGTYTTVGDVTAPATPTGLTITGSYNEAILKWNLATEKDYKETLIFSNTVNSIPATPTLIITGNTVTVFDLAKSTTFYVWLKHVDFSGNISAASTVVTFSTTSGLTDVALADNAVTTPKINGLAVTEAKLGNNAVTTSKIDAGAVTNAKLDPNAVAANVFAAGVQPLEIFATVPLTRTVDTIFVTSTAKLYRWNGTAYVKSVDNDDIVSIVADKITAGTINAAITTTNILQLSTNGKIYTAGKTSAASATKGVFLGHDGGSDYDFAVGDGTKSIVWDGSAGTFTVTNVDITTTGKVQATGGFLFDGISASIHGVPTAPGTKGVYGNGLASDGVFGTSSASSGVHGQGTGTGASAVRGQATVTAAIGGDFSNIWGGTALNVLGSSTFTGGDITTADSIVMTGATKNLVIGNATNTGNSNLVIKEGVAGSRLDNQMIVYGALSTDADTTLGIITEQDVVAGTGAFAGILQIRIVWNGAEYWLPLQAV
jgi:hypothetical protein